MKTIFSSLPSDQPGVLPARRGYRFLSAVLLGLTLTACGGGGGGGVTPTTPPAAIPAAIVTQPSDQAVSVGSAANFSVSASGTAPISYQWQRNGVDIAGANAASFSVASPTLDDHQASYRVRVGNAAGSVTSSAATLRVSGIELFAGLLNDAVGSTVDGARTVARLEGPTSLAFDSAGVLWFAGRGGIRKIAPDGTVATLNFAPLRPFTDYLPLGLTFDRSGTLFFTDGNQNNVYRVSAAGAASVLRNVSAVIPGRGQRLNSPTSLLFDGSGNLYTTNCAGTRKIAADGSVAFVQGGDALPTQNTGTECFSSLVQDAAGNVYFSQNFGFEIGRVTPAGVSSTFVNRASLPGPVVAMAFDAAGNLMVATQYNICRVTPAGVVTVLAGATGQTEFSTQTGHLPGRFTILGSLAIDARGALYVGDRNSILKIVLP